MAMHIRDPFDPGSFHSTTQPLETLLPEGQIKAVAVDLGGVLIGFDWAVVRRAFVDRTSRPEDAVIQAFITAHQLGYERGMINTKAFVAAINRELRSDISVTEFCRLWNLSFRKVPEMDHLLRLLKKQIPLIAISNTNPAHWQRLGTQVERYFDSIYLSFKIGHAKPSQEFWQHLTHALPPEQILVIDDLRPNVEAAAELGFPVHQYTDIERLRNHLCTLGFNCSPPPVFVGYK
jgi:FMN phosphatase YigB (HAD superfamily)